MKLGLKNKANAWLKEIKYWSQNKLFKPNLFNLNSKERLGAIFHEPSDMCITDRVMLYALVRGLKPMRALEIGARWGGSARIITNAMEDNERGCLVGIDPNPQNFRAKFSDLHNRYKLLEGYSPDITEDAVKYLEGKLDFVFVDGMHTHDAALADLRGILPYLADDAYVVVHDTYHQGVNQAVLTITQESSLFDCGILTRNPKVKDPVSYQGLRLMHNGVVDGQQLIKKAYLESDAPEPIFSEELWNYDPYLVELRKRASVSGITIDNSGREVKPEK